MKKIGLYNIRGVREIGVNAKKKELQQLVRLNKLNMIFLHRLVCSELWEGDEFACCFKQSMGRSGG